MVELDRIICGDCLEELRTLLNDSVDCCVTSPPYYGLRDYGIDGQIGLEPTPEAYVARLVEVFREVRRVLKPDGTLFLNLGDSYFGSQMTGGNNGFNKSGGENGFKMKRQFKKPSHGKRVQSCDTSGKGELDSSYRDCSSENLCDGRIDSWWNHISDNDLHHVHEQVAALCQQIPANMVASPARLPIEDCSYQQQIQQSLNAMLDQERSLIPAIEQLLSFQETKPIEYVPPLLGGSMPKDMLLAFLSSLRSLRSCAQEFGYKSGDPLEKLCCIQGNVSPFGGLTDHIRCTSGYYSIVSAWLKLPYIQPHRTTRNYINTSLKPKDLIGIPWMVAFALRADGWYLRSDIIWEKPNCMPESCKDRPTKSHEYIFLLSKSQRYYYDAEAIKEPNTEGTKKRLSSGPVNPIGKSGNKASLVRGDAGGSYECLNGRNKRTVWTIPTKPFPGSHFAVMPEKLVEPCILAGTSERGYCPACGKAWERHIERSKTTPKEIETYSKARPPGGGDRYKHSLPSKIKTLCWRPSCSCILDCAWPGPQPAVVLDPFFGAGTVGLVAKKLGRWFIGIELNPEYIQMAKARIERIPVRLDQWEEDVRP